MAASAAASTPSSRSAWAPSSCSSAGRRSTASRRAASPGAAKALQIFRREVDLSMAQIGATEIADLGPQFLMWKDDGGSAPQPALIFTPSSLEGRALSPDRSIGSGVGESDDLAAFASCLRCWRGALASLLAGLATAVGALPILVIRKLSDEAQDVMLGFAAGVMLAASFFSLIIPGLDVAQEQGATKLGAVSLVIAGILFGAGEPLAGPSLCAA